MPSQLLHSLFGEDVIAGILRRVESGLGEASGKYVFAPEKLRADYAALKNVFALGCQGPDIFYHSRRRRPVGLEYGTLLHRRGIGDFASELLAASLSGNLSGGINAEGLYALGFMTHAFLDRQAHPFIVYKSFSFSPKTTDSISYAQAHAFFERIIDALMFKHSRGAEVSSWDQEALLSQPCENPPPALKELLARCLVKVFPERAGKDGKLDARVANAFLDSAGFYRATSPESVTRKIRDKAAFFDKDHLVYVYPENLPQCIDFLNLEKRPWFYPAGAEKEDARSFPEIYSGAVAAAVDSLSGIIVRYLEDGSFPAEEAARAIGNGGLSIVDESGSPCPPSRSDPLPLNETLEQQMAMRESWG